MIRVRSAGRADASALSDLINPIIARGGTTAYEERLDKVYFRSMIDGLGQRDFIHVAETSDGIVGFQLVEKHDALPDDTGDIATFVAIDAAGRGVGRALADATFARARGAGWRRLHAYIRSDNAGGLAYYEKIGLRTERVDPARPLKDGTPVDRIAKTITL